MKLVAGIPSRLAQSLRTSRNSRVIGSLQVRNPSTSVPKTFTSPLATVSALRQQKKPLATATTLRQRRTYSTSNMATDIASVLTPACLKEVRDFWFEHLPHDDELIVPGQTANARWWAGGSEFDTLCAQRFAPTLEGIKASGVTSGADLLAACPPQEPCDWLSLLLLLDQLPRNIYRGDAARTVFTVFDPLAEEVAQEAIAAGVPDEEAEVRWQFGYRLWFYMPLEHSETLAVHELALRKFEQLGRDVELLLRSGDEEEGEAKVVGESEYRARAREVVRADPEAARAFVGLQLDFEKRHQAIIRRFGRYPHRNAPLGRESTAEEKEYLASGGETFAAPKEEGEKS